MKVEIGFIVKKQRREKSITIFEDVELVEVSVTKDYWHDKKSKDKYKCGVCNKWCRGIEYHIKTKRRERD